MKQLWQCLTTSSRETWVLIAVKITVALNQDTNPIRFKISCTRCRLLTKWNSLNVGKNTSLILGFSWDQKKKNSLNMETSNWDLTILRFYRCNKIIWNINEPRNESNKIIWVLVTCRVPLVRSITTADEVRNHWFK